MGWDAPPPEALRWAAASVGRSARVTSIRRLTGGIASAAHELRIEARDGTARSFVLRRFLRVDRFRADAVAIESRVLKALEQTAIPAPRLVAVDEHGSTSSAPALLTLKLPGRIELRPDRVRDYAEQIANMAARIHADLPVDAPAVLDWTWPDKDAASWSRRPALWAQVASVLAQPPSTTTTRFVHGDFQHFNLLWARGHLSGVVDWSLAMRGHPSRDLGHCRLNLAALHGPDIAEQVRRAWQTETGWDLDPWWDLFALNAWGPRWLDFLPLQVGRRLTVDWTRATERVEALIEIALRRV